MKKLILFTLYSVIVYFPAFLLAQETPCIYRLELSDAMGDGWNGARLEIDVNAQTTSYSMLDGSSDRFYIPLLDGDQVSIRFISGDEDEEIGFGFYSETEELILEATGVLPLGGTAFTTTINCASCPVPPISGVEVTNILAVTADINWIAPDTAGNYLIEFGPDGITPGQGDSTVYQGSTTGQLNLSEKTAYTFYISSICANGDTSEAIGPFNFETCYANDVGAFAITGPETDCNLLAGDSVKTILINYGANPQSLIPFAYSVNQEPVNIDMPRDGIYTGVLGKDSLGYPIFDATYDFSAPGEYYIEVWTEYEEDSDLSNDTISTTIYSLATVAELPYREDFEGAFASWTIGEDSENPSWALGTPTGGVINSAASGSNAWATNLNGASNAGELSYLLSPCMDFTSVFTDPIIAFQLWESTEAEVDQFWLESSIDGGETFQTIPLFTDLSPGVYQTVVRDRLNCPVFFELTVLDCTVDATFEVTDATGSDVPDGEILVTAINGRGPFTYSIDGGGTFQEEPLFQQLLPDTFPVVVRDSLNCGIREDVIVDFTTSVRNTVIGNTLKVFPNPSAEVFTIELRGLSDVVTQ